MKKPITAVGAAPSLALLTIGMAAPSLRSADGASARQTASVAQAQRGSAPPRGPAAQTASPYNGARTPERKPDLNSIWQALGTAHWNVEAHSASEGVPAGLSVVEGGTIPYQPWA